MAGSVLISKAARQHKRRDGQIVTAVSQPPAAVSSTVQGGQAGGGMPDDLEILRALLNVDGEGSQIDADLLDGHHAVEFAPADHGHDDRYYTKQEIDEVLALKIEAASPAFTGTATFDNAAVGGLLTVDGGIESSDFITGLAGSGFGLTAGEDGSRLEVDNLTVRKSLSAYEYTVHRLRSTNGSLIVAPGTRAMTGILTDAGGYYFTVAQGEQVFAPGDIIKSQVFTGTGAGELVYRVASVAGINVYITGEDGSAPAVTDIANREFVRIGSASDTDRQGCICLTGDDTGSPRLDVIDGVDSSSVFNTGKAGVILGRLDGTGKTFGGNPVSGYGFYAENAYITGRIAGTLLYIDGNGMLGNVADDMEDAMEACAKTAGLTVIDGGLITANIIKLGDADGLEHGGINGTACSESDSLPVLWGGGTYEAAVAGECNAIIRHDGTARFGSVYIMSDGTAAVRDGNNGTNLIELRATNIETISDVEGTSDSHTVRLTPLQRSFSFNEAGTVTYNEDGSADSHTVTHNGTEAFIEITLSAIITTILDLSPVAELSLLLRPGNIYLGRLLVRRDSGGQQTVIRQTVRLAAGTYYPVLLVGCSAGICVDITMTGTIIYVYETSLKRNVFGKDGLLLSYNGNNYFRAAVNGNNRLDVDIVTEGRFRIPGFTAAGYVYADGTVHNQYGCVSCGCAKQTGEGFYRVTFNAPIAEYWPLVTTFGSSVRIVRVSAIETTYFDVRVNDASNREKDSAFLFAVFSAKA